MVLIGRWLLILKRRPLLPRLAGTPGPCRVQPASPSGVRLSRCAAGDSMNGDLAEALTLLPPRLTTLVELEQREHGDRDGHAILAAHRLLEGEVAAL